jgi:hypothetical protein
MDMSIAWVNYWTKSFKSYWLRRFKDTENEDWKNRFLKGKGIIDNVSTGNRLALYRRYKRIGLMTFKEPSNHDPFRGWVVVFLLAKGADVFGVPITQSMEISQRGYNAEMGFPAEQENHPRGKIIWVKV